MEESYVLEYINANEFDVKVVLETKPNRQQPLDIIPKVEGWA